MSRKLEDTQAVDFNLHRADLLGNLRSMLQIWISGRVDLLMPISIELERRLRWADADAAGRLHFPRIFEIVEEAESELVRSIAWPMNRSMGYDFPRVHLECKFLRILALDSRFRLRLTVGKLGRTSIRYDYQVFDGDEELAIDGTMTIVVLQHGKPTEIPATLRAALSEDKLVKA
jgi:acyl-CoA thioester hydrolase